MSYDNYQHPSTGSNSYSANYTYSSNHGKPETSPQHLYTDHHAKPSNYSSTFGFGESPTSTHSTGSTVSHQSTGGYPQHNTNTVSYGEAPKKSGYGYSTSGVSSTYSTPVVSGYGVSEAPKKSGYGYGTTGVSGYTVTKDSVSSPVSAHSSGSNASNYSAGGYATQYNTNTASYGTTEAPKKSGYGYSTSGVSSTYSTPVVSGHVSSGPYVVTETVKKSGYGAPVSTYGASTYGTPGYGVSKPSGHVISETVKKSGYEAPGVSAPSGNYGSYGYSSTTSYNANPAPTTTQYAVTSSRPSTSNYGPSTSYGYGTNPGAVSYGTTSPVRPSTGLPSYVTTSITQGAPSGTNYGSYSYGGPAQTYNPTPSQPQQQAYSYSKTNVPGTSTSYGGYSYGGSTYNPAPSQPQQQSYSYGQSSVPTQAVFSNPFSTNCTKSPYPDLLNKLRSSGQKFRDQEYPPELRSLTGGLSDYELSANGNSLDWRSLVWLRAEEVYGKNNFQVFQGKIEPNDIKQGALGDCYFLSTLASLAETPDRIRRIFESTTPNENGCYAVRICDAGIWQTILLDDYLPCDANSKKPAFTTGNGNEIWVQLLEKAWAKVYGSYARIEAGLTRECLHDLTGAPTKYYLTSQTDKHEEIWHAISHGEKKNYAMTCGAGDFFEGADLMSSIGLVGSHAYSMLSAVEVTDRYGRKVRLVKLRNPWGKGEWTGDWSDQSPCWTEELKRQVNLERKEDGTFYMAFEEMLKYFSDIQICKIHDDYKYKAIKATCDSRHGVYFKINVRVPGHYFITINQESTRKHRESENYKYSTATIVLGKKTSNGYSYVEGYQRADKEVWTDGHLEAGEYIVYSKIAWNDRRPKDFSISCYGQGDVEIEKIPKSSCANFVEQVYLDKGRQNKKLQSYQDLGVTNCYRAYDFSDDDGFAYFYYRNQSNKTLEEEIFFKSAQGLKLKKPYRGNSFKMVVPPGQERILVAKVSGGVSFSERAGFR